MVNLTEVSQLSSGDKATARVTLRLVSYDSKRQGADADFIPAAEEFDELSLHRYPSPSHLPLKERICSLRNVPSTSNIFLGVGSDEVIDLLFRITCAPGRDRVLVCPPTYGMYSVCAQINDVQVVKCNLDVQDGAFRPKVDEVSFTRTWLALLQRH